MFDNEQWKSEGNCEICRRKSYCKKSCAASDRAVRREIGSAIVNVSGKTVGAYIASAISATNKYNLDWSDTDADILGYLRKIITDVSKDGENDEMQ